MDLEILGLFGGLLVTISLLPQVIKSYKTKSTKDISIVYTLILMTGLAFWVLYAILNKIIPLAIFASIEFLMTLSLLILKLKYK
jgi:MtN3 and saliva related transmembrane protein